MKKKIEKCATYFTYHPVENKSVGSRSRFVLIMHRTLIPEAHFITADTISIHVTFLSGLLGFKLLIRWMIV